MHSKKEKPSRSDKANDQVYVSKDAKGKAHTLRAGENGVTPQWILYLHTLDKREKASQRKYYKKSNGKQFERFLFSFDEVSKGELERLGILIDKSTGAEENLISKEIQDEEFHRIWKAYYALNPEQRWIAWAVFVKGMPQKKAAQILRIDPTSLRDRLEAIKRRMLNNY